MVGFPKLNAVAGEVGLSIRDVGTFNGMWAAVLQHPT